MTTLLDHLDTRSAPAATGTTITPAQRLRSTMAAARVSFTWMGTQKTLNRRAEGPRRRDVRRRGAVPLRRQEADRHQSHGLPRRHGDPGQGRRLLEGALAAVPRARRPADQARHRRVVRRPDGRLPDRAGRRRGQPRSALCRTQAGRPRAAGHRCSTRRTIPRPWSASSAVEWGFPSVEPPDYLVQLSPGLYEAERAQGLGPVRGGRPARRAGVPRRVRPARRPPHRADLGRRRGRPAPGLPRLGRRQPPGVLRPVPVAQRPLERPARRPGRRGPAGGPGSRRPGSPRGEAGSVRPWPAQLSRVQTSLDAMLVDRPRRRILRQVGRGLMKLVIEPDGQVRAMYSRGDRPRRARPAEDLPGQRRRARRRRPLACRPPAPAGAGARAVRSAVARPWPPRSPGWKSTGSCPST